jgi:hypothetical protein
MRGDYDVRSVKGENLCFGQSLTQLQLRRCTVLVSAHLFWVDLCAVFTKHNS